MKDHPQPRALAPWRACQPVTPAARSLCTACAAALLLLLLLLLHAALFADWRVPLEQRFFLAKYDALTVMGLGPGMQRPVTMAAALASLGGAQPVSARSAALLALRRAQLEDLARLPPAASGAAGVRLAVRARPGPPRFPRNQPWVVGPQRPCPLPCTLAPSNDASVDALVDFEPYGGLAVAVPPGALLPQLTVTQENFYLTGTGAGTGTMAFGGAHASLAPSTLAILQASTWLSSYELDSNLPLPYLKEVRALQKWRAPLPAPALAPALRFPRRLPAIAAFISNCDLFSMSPPRALYVRELSRFYPVHHYGRCNASLLVGGQLGEVAVDGAAAAAAASAVAAAAASASAAAFAGGLDSLAAGDPGANVDKLRVLSAYRYAIAIENSLAQDYVSEKVYEALAAGAVPVYLGAPNVADLLPSAGAIVHVRDFESPGALAARLHALDRSEQAWLGHQQWRTRAVPQAFADLQAVADYEGVTLACRACACVAGHLGCPGMQ